MKLRQRNTAAPRGTTMMDPRRPWEKLPETGWKVQKDVIHVEKKKSSRDELWSLNRSPQKSADYPSAIS